MAKLNNTIIDGTCAISGDLTLEGGIKSSLAITSDSVPQVAINCGSAKDAFYTALRTDTNVKVSFGVGSGGTNHGIWSNVLNKWIIHSDGSDVYINSNKVADQIVAYKLSGVDNWSWVKYASGIAECWIFYGTDVAPYSASGSTSDFQYYRYKIWDLPFSFVPDDSTYYCGYTKTAAASVDSVPTICITGHLNDTPSSVCLHWASKLSSGRSYINLHLKGRWK